MAIPQEVRQVIDPRRSALILIDLQRRHMDPEVGYHTVAAEHAATVLTRAARALHAARAAGMPVVHVITYNRRPSPWGLADGRNPFMAYQAGKPIPGLNRPRITGRNVEGSPYAEVMPAVAPGEGEPVVVKRRYSGFYATDLELVLRGLGAETLFIAGVNTNNCVLATVFEAHSRDYRVVVLGDCCGSMNGDEYHRFALKEIEAALGFVCEADEFAALVGAAGAANPVPGNL